nr:MAG TPA: hypothetical protein [Caudoviricetes sp.]
MKLQKHFIHGAFPLKIYKFFYLYCNITIAFCQEVCYNKERK